MTLTIRPIEAADQAALGALVSDPSLEREFDKLLPPGAVERWLRDPYADPGMCLVAHDGAEPAGLTIGFRLPSPAGDPWAGLRLGVLGRHRRRGIGSRLLAHALDHLRGGAARVTEVSISAWVPDPAAAGFAARHGFVHARTFWRMERPRHLGIAESSWPSGVETRLFDGNEAMLLDWDRVYNRSFAEHYHFVPSTPAILRERMGFEEFRRGAVLLAYRDGACVGFCRNAILGRRGEIATLGVVREARGLGLGRALLRWGVRWFAERDVDRVELGVDGENESALALYRSEAFEVAETREFWSLDPAPPSARSSAPSSP